MNGDRLARLLKPRTVAVIGGSVAAEVIRQCRRIGYAGAIWPVNPGRAELEGLPCFASVADLPGAPDAAFVAVSREASIAVLAALDQRGAGGAVCYASGFSEVGGAGVALQQQLVESAGGLAVVGPNCYGLLNYLDGCALWPDHHGGSRIDRGVAIITQSGNIGLNLTLQRRSLPIAYMIAVGNTAVTDFHDYIDALLDDPRVSAIGLHIEGLRDVHAFSLAAIKALKKGVPLIALKTGVSAIAAQTTASHTSAMAGPDDLYAALFERLGVARVSDLGCFIETLKLVHCLGPLPGTGLVSMSCSGGDAALIADIAESQGLEFPALAPAVIAGVAGILGPLVAVRNPLDYQTYIWGDEPALTRCFVQMMQADADVALLVLDFPLDSDAPIPGWEESIAAFITACGRSNKPGVVLATMPELLPGRIAQRLLAAGIAPMQGVTETMTAIRAAALVGARQRHADEIRPVARRCGGFSGNSYHLDEVKSKRVLAAHGLVVPPGQVVDSADHAVRAAAAIGYPVVVKAVSDQLSHKTEQGAVQLNLRDESGVRRACASMADRDGPFLVESMVTGAVAELLVGIAHDDQFGLALTIGSGGIFVELMDDCTTLLLPVSRGDIAVAVQKLKVATLLGGYRGRPKADLPALLSAIEAVVGYAEGAAESLLELEVNPLLALPEGAVAVDAVIRIASRESPEPEATDAVGGG